jgi:predicted ArsR family transcriptional regulator
MKTSREYQSFSKAMGTILKADPEAVKAAMDAEKRGRALEAERTGKRGRGRPPKLPLSSSDHASSETD